MIAYWIVSNIAEAAAKAGKKIVDANSLLLKFVVIGWGIYPLGYLIGTADGQWYGALSGFVTADIREVIYNIGDAVNKIGFGLVIWSVAKK